MSAGQSSSVAQSLTANETLAGQPSGALADIAIAGATKLAHATSTRALTAEVVQPGSPRDVRPTSCSAPPIVENTGPPLSPVQVTAGEGIASKLASRTASSAIVPSRFVPGSAAVALDTPKPTARSRSPLARSATLPVGAAIGATGASSASSSVARSP